MSQEIDRVRELLPNLPTRADAARQLIELGFEQAYTKIIELWRRALEDARASGELTGIYLARIMAAQEALHRITNSTKGGNPPIEVVD